MHSFVIACGGDAALYRMKYAHLTSLAYCAEALNDMYSFTLATGSWSQLELGGNTPSPRGMMGLAATDDGYIYIFGGTSDLNNGTAWHVTVGPY